MKFSTKLWQRSPKSFATTIPQVALFQLDLSKKYSVIWDFDQKNEKWTVSFSEKKTTARIKTKLWKRSQRSFATTIPYAAIFTLDENKGYDLVWEYDTKLKKWTLDFVMKKVLDEKKK